MGSLGRCKPQLRASSSAVAGIVDVLACHALSIAVLFAVSIAAHAGVAEWEAHIKRGFAEYERGDQPAAEANFASALKEAEAFGEADQRLPLTLNVIGATYLSGGDYARAEPLLKRGLDIRERILGRSHPHVAVSLNNLSMLHSAQGRYAEAEPLLKRAVEIWERSLGPWHPHVAASLNNLAMLYSAQGKYIQAEAFLKRALDVRDAGSLGTTLENMSRLYTKLGRVNEAQEYAQQAAKARALHTSGGEQSQYVTRSLPR